MLFMKATAEYVKKKFTVYESPKYLLVRDWFVTIIYRGIQLTVLCYICLWNIWYKHGYQREEYFTGQATIKIKGNTKSNSGRFFDAVDLVIPPQEAGGVFITTNYVHTPHQKHCLIPGVDKKGSAPAEISEICTDNVTHTCPARRMTSNGVSTGRCLMNDQMGMEMCEIMTWCPLEDDNIGRVNILPHTGNFTVFIRIDGRYPSRPYHPISNVDLSLVYNLNLFYVSDISAAGGIKGNPLTPSDDDPQKLPLHYFNDTIEKGQIILIAFTFDCNMDYDLNKCKPEITFQRIDDSDFSSGFNFRYSSKYYVDGEEQRDLWKIYGIKIIVTVEGIGREYEAVTMFIAFGSGIGLFSLANILCDKILRYFIRQDEVFRIMFDDHCINTTASMLHKISKEIQKKSQLVLRSSRSSNHNSNVSSYGPNKESTKLPAIQELPSPIDR